MRLSRAKFFTTLEVRAAYNPSPKHLKDVQSFLGFANFYRRFIKGYSDIVSPLTALTKKGQGKHVPFVWGPAQQDAFDRLKTAFTTAPILAHFDFDRQTAVERDASDYVSAGILSQCDVGESCTLWLTSQRNTRPRSATTRFMTRSLWPPSGVLRSGPPHLEGAPCRSKSCLTMKTWSILCPLSF